MDEPNEEAILLAVLKRRGKKPNSATKRAVVGSIVLVVVAVATFGLVVGFGMPNMQTIVLVLSSLLLSGTIAVLLARDGLTRQWVIIENYVDFEAVEARLRYLEEYPYNQGDSRR